MSTSALQWFVTEDGTLTGHHPDLQESYHNRAGALTEARLNYVEPSGLVAHYRETGTLRVLDPTFGLGYNTWALLVACQLAVPEGDIEIIAIEPDSSLLKTWPAILNQPCFATLLPVEKAVHGLDPQQPQQTLELELGRHDITLSFYWQPLQEVLPTLSGPLDAVFHDAFSPKKAPDLWTEAILSQYHHLLHPKTGCLLTYSRSPDVLATLERLGFHLSRTAAVGAKRGGTLARMSD